jgi:flavin reductase (DIM6/NTAB) family NADH-FMN oxidoreductase RutF
MSEVDRAAFRRAASRFASGIVVVTTSLEGVSHAMTVTAFTAVSLDPLLVLMCAEKVARFHDAVMATGTWAVSVLGEDAEKTAAWLATRGRPLAGQLDAIRHHAGPLTGAPILDDALAAMECRTTAVYDGGDHSIVLGEVIGVTEPRPGAPLLHWASRYHRLRDARPSRSRPRAGPGPSPGPPG